MTYSDINWDEEFVLSSQDRETLRAMQVKLFYLSTAKGDISYVLKHMSESLKTILDNTQIRLTPETMR